MRRAESARLPCHPATALLLWLFFIVWMQQVGMHQWLTAAVVLTPVLWRAGWQQWLRYLRRSRWLLLAIVLANAWALPGTPLVNIDLLSGLTREGISGAAQTGGRLVLLLMSLAICMARMTRDDWLVAIDTVLSPLRCFGVPVRRVALRIGLTLFYAERLLADRSQLPWQQRFARLFDLPEADADPQRSMTWVARPFGWHDAVCLGGVVAAGVGIRWLWN